MNAPANIPPAVRTACPYCGVGCGVLARPNAEGGAIVIGDPDHPANFGKLCSKGFALGETLGLESRLLHPMLRQPDGSHARADWDAALDVVADGFKRIAERDGPGSIAFYLSGQLLTEDYYVANKLMKGFLGSANVDTNSRLCMASSVAGHRRAFGGDIVPGNYEDLDLADLIVLVGSNAAWCHPVLFQRMVRNRRDRGAKLVVIDPRRTVTADDADLFLPIAPGTDTALFCGLLAHLADTGRLDDAYIEAQHHRLCRGARARARRSRRTSRRPPPRPASTQTDVAQFFKLFAAKPRSVTCFSQGVNQSAQGTDKVNAIINCHLATGRIGRPGMGPFSLTGQPNAMGGREVGGLANQLAAHMSFAPDDVDRVRRFWNAPRMAEREGLKAVQMFEAIERGEIKALWVMATNPATSLPRAAAMRAALQKARAVRRLRQRAAQRHHRRRRRTCCCRPRPGARRTAPSPIRSGASRASARSCRCRARRGRTGGSSPTWRSAWDLPRRSPIARRPTCSASTPRCRRSRTTARAPSIIGALAAISDRDYEALEPVQWPVARRAARDASAAASPTAASSPPTARRGSSRRSGRRWREAVERGISAAAQHRPPARPVAHHDAVGPEPDARRAPAGAVRRGSSGRCRRRTGCSHDGFASVSTAHGSCILKVVVSAGQRRGSIFAPIHWSDLNASSARIGDLVAPVTDPFSGQPEAKATPAAIAPVEFAWRGFALSRRPLALPRRHLVGAGRDPGRVGLHVRDQRRA